MADLTVKLLEAIRDELSKTRQDLSARIDATNERLERLERRQTESEVRLATELVGVASAVHQLRDVLIEDRKLRDAVDDHERRLRKLEKRRAG